MDQVHPEQVLRIGEYPEPALYNGRIHLGIRHINLTRDRLGNPKIRDHMNPPGMGQEIHHISLNRDQGHTHHKKINTEDPLPHLHER